MESSFDARLWSFVWDMVQTVVVTILAIYTWLVNRTKANRAAIDRVDSRLNRIQERVNLVENNLMHMPSHDDLGRVYEKLNAVNSTMQELKGEMRTVNKTLGLLNEYLLKEKDR